MGIPEELHDGWGEVWVVSRPFLKLQACLHLSLGGVVRMQLTVKSRHWSDKWELAAKH